MEINVDMEVVQAVYTDDHRLLKNKDASDQHPVSAITGLAEKHAAVDLNLNNLNISVSDLQEDVGNLSIQHVALSERVSAQEALTQEHDLAIEELEGAATPATADKLGTVKIGDGINVEEDGTISASGGASGNTLVTFSQSNGVWSADVSGEDLYQAITSGKTAVGYTEDAGSPRYFNVGFAQNVSTGVYVFTFSCLASDGSSYAAMCFVWQDVLGVATIQYIETMLASQEDLSSAIGGAINGSY